MYPDDYDDSQDSLAATAATPVNQTMVGPLSAALDLMRKRQQGSMTSQRQVGGSAPSSPLTMALRPTTTRALPDADSPEAAYDPEGNRHVQVIRGGVESDVNMRADSSPVETLNQDPRNLQRYHEQQAEHLFGSTEAERMGLITPERAQQKSQFMARYLAQPHIAAAMNPPVAAGKLPDAQLAALMQNLSPEQTQELQAFRQAGAKDTQVIQKLMSMQGGVDRNARTDARHGNQGFAAATQQDRYQLSQAQQALKTLDKKARPFSFADPDMSRLTPDGQTQYQTLPQQIKAAQDKIGGFGAGDTGSLPKPPQAGAPASMQIVHQFMLAAGGDKNKARQLAAQAGWSF